MGNLRKVVVLVALMVGLGGASTAWGVTYIVMNAQSAGINGESKRAGRENWIDLLSLDFGLQSTVQISSTSGGGAGKASASPIAVTKFVDTSSPGLATQLLLGKRMDKVEIDFVRTGGELNDVFMTLDLCGVFVSSVDMSGADGVDKVSETIELIYEAYKVTYTPQDDTGKLGGPVEAGWSFVLNAPGSC